MVPFGILADEKGDAGVFVILKAIENKLGVALPFVTVLAVTGLITISSFDPTGLSVTFQPDGYVNEKPPAVDVDVADVVVCAGCVVVVFLG